MDTAQPYISSLLLAGVEILCLLVLLAIAFQSQLRRPQHILLFCFFVNFFVALGGELLYHIHIFLPVISASLLPQPSWYAFGPIILLYAYFVVYSGRAVHKAVLWLMFMPGLIELSLNFLSFLVNKSFISLGSSGNFQIVTWAYRYPAYSFAYFVFFAGALLLLVARNNYYRKYRLLFSIKDAWIWGLSLFLVLMIVAELFLLPIYLHLTCALFMLYVACFIIMVPEIISGGNTTSEDRMKQIFEISDKGVIMLDKTGLIIYANDQIHDRLGYTDSKLIGAHISALISDTSFLSKVQSGEVDGDINVMAKGKDRVLHEVAVASNLLDAVLAGRFTVLYVTYHQARGMEYTQEEQRLINHLLRLLKDERLYLNPHLQQEKIADELGVGKRKVAELIASTMAILLSILLTK